MPKVKLTPDEEAKKREGETPKRGGHTNPKKRKKDAEAMASLPTTVVPHPVPDAERQCPHCGDDIRPIGAGDRSVEYEWVPGRLERRVHVVEVGRCPCKMHYARGPAPRRVQEGCTCDPAFLAKLAVDKCADATPIYRVEKAMRRAGIPLSRSTMNDLALLAADLCIPLHLVTQGRYGETRSRSNNGLAHDRRRYGIQRRHRRRRARTYRLLESCAPSSLRRTPSAPEARAGLDIILDPFMVERKATNLNIIGTSRHHELRRSRSAPILRRLREWREKTAPLFEPKSAMGEALRYMKNQWSRLTAFLADPLIPIHNNASEAALRIVALARKSSLFFGNEKAGRRFILPDHPKQRVPELLPDRRKQSFGSGFTADGVVSPRDGT